MATSEPAYFSITFPDAAVFEIVGFEFAAKILPKSERKPAAPVPARSSSAYQATAADGSPAGQSVQGNWSQCGRLARLGCEAARGFHLDTARDRRQLPCHCGGPWYT